MTLITKMLSSMNQSITFRPIAPEDEPFLYRLYASTREEEIALTGWNDTEKEAFLRQQFTSQHKFYVEQFTKAEFQLILINAEPIGRLYVDRREDEIRLIDIALLPEHRSKGIGSRLLQELLDEGKKIGKPVRIHVERFNPAMRLYERLGFTTIDDQGMHYLMEWSSKSAGEVNTLDSQESSK